MRILIAAVLLVLGVSVALAAAANSSGKDKDKDAATANAAATTHVPQDDPMRLEGERRFHANCGRCHAAPPKFPARMMGTIIRHMRVRATITAEDMRSILHYMTQ
jgi:mono/diheme cytochrome c family protein